MESKSEGAKRLEEEVLSIKQEMESELTPYRMKLQEIQNEITRISQPFEKRIKQKEQEYLVDILPHLKEWDSGVIGGNLHRRTYATSSQS